MKRRCLSSARNHASSGYDGLSHRIIHSEVTVAYHPADISNGQTLDLGGLLMYSYPSSNQSCPLILMKKETARHKTHLQPTNVTSKVGSFEVPPLHVIPQKIQQVSELTKSVELFIICL